MTPATLFKYLIGRRDAILEIAASRHALKVGFLLTISAALARHYDGKYLVREPWFLLAPAAASIATSSIIFLAFWLAGSAGARQLLRPIWPTYLGFLRVYWMTAPLAWLYAVPYERFLSDVNAAQANVWTLELVSVWRVLLMSRAVAVLACIPFGIAFVRIAVPALALFYVALNYARMPLIDWMGGVRVPLRVQPVANAYLEFIFYGFFALVVGSLTWLAFLALPRNTSLEGFQFRQSDPLPRGVIALVAIVIFGFVAVLPVTQREQWLRYQVERDLKHNQIDAALNILATHRQKEFPPQWTPPPWPEYGDGDTNPNMVALVKALQRRQDVPAWVQAAYREKADLYLSHRRGSLPAEHEQLLRYFALSHD